MEGEASTDGGSHRQRAAVFIGHREWVVERYQGCRIWFRCCSCKEVDSKKGEDPCILLASGQVGKR